MSLPWLYCWVASSSLVSGALLPSPPHITAREWREGLAMDSYPSSDTKLVGSCLGTPSSTPQQQLRQLLQILVDRRWPNSQVVYHLEESLLPQDRLVVTRAMQVIEDISCVRFVPYNPEKHLLSVSISRDCPCNPYKKSCKFIGAAANVGPLPHGIGRLIITGACLEPSNPRSIGLITHELFHTLGISHLQERADRDLYVSINWFNIQLFSLFNFKWNPFYAAEGIPYDCDSIMHYDDSAFSNGRGPTMTARDPEHCDLRHPLTNHPTSGDEALLNKAYNCDRPVEYSEP